MATKNRKTDKAEDSGRNDVYALLVPVTYCGETITEVSFRRLTGKDQIAVEREMNDRLGPAHAASAGEQERGMYILARATGRPVECIEMMDLADIRAMQQQWGLNFFLQP